MARIAEAIEDHRLIGIDTSVFIYHIEDVVRYSTQTKIVFDQIASGAIEGVTSVLTLMELAVKPLQMGRPEVADEYEVILSNFPHLRIAGLDRQTMRTAAELRATYRLRPADSIQVAACLRNGATAFLTNDRDLQLVKEITVIVLEDFISR